MPFCLDLATIDIDQIAHGLEEVEGDSGGEQDLHGDWVYGQAAGFDQQIDTVYDGSGGLVEEKYQHKGKDAAQEAAVFRGCRCCLFQLKRQHICQCCCREQKETVGDVQVHVEYIAGSE